MKIVRQIKVFESTRELNEWLVKNHDLNIITIDVRFAPASYYRYFVHYYIEKEEQS